MLFSRKPRGWNKINEMTKGMSDTCLAYMFVCEFRDEHLGSLTNLGRSKLHRVADRLEAKLLKEWTM